MRVVYMGTPEFAVPALQALHGAGYEIALVISQPDRPRGRGRQANPTPVAATARELGLPLLQPAKVNDPEVVEQVQELAPDAIVVAAFGQILRKPLLQIPAIGCVNIHASLLPQYRGGSPVQHALLAGERVTGITIMLMDEGMDTGPILMQREVLISPEDTAGTLLDRLARVGADLLLEALPALAAGRLEPTPQDASRATYAPNLSREDARIDWSSSAEKIRNQVRAFSPKPGAWAEFRGKEVKIWRARVDSDATDASPGQIVAIGPESIRVATGEGTLWLEEVQEAGKSRMGAGAFARGARLAPGERFS
ncbi:MAG TPA: methionyl-tRNA formyltransferase [Armatimonadota bacterium]|jgi:methionyl-tRNA formyltransferase|nr:methionyl-tRNA formyltransferase [Armatimonadota bacterium]HPO71436.1 methionyl-tRNA formyltransferase [Armatimonadota bacterium]HPT98777.1 methionyl-tRNA formyltransferase [Armatimonadota bacterium]